MALSTRQPFAELGGTSRLHALSSAKNRQNAMTPNFSSPSGKPAPITGKRRAPAVFEDNDSENIDPSIFTSPTKRSKTGDAGFSKPSPFSLVTAPSKPSPTFTASPSIPSVRKALSSPNTTKSTPISHSRGSPKHKRVGLLSKRRVSSSPFRRVDPPSFTHNSSPALPFSIDAALSGTIPNYTPKTTPVATPAATPSNASALDDSMPKSWFFEIHEDTPEQEAANLMEHSAAVLDISSDDDDVTRKRNEELERGKENIPPPDFLAQLATTGSSTDAMQTGLEAVETEHVKLPRLRKIAQDAMEEDRAPLSDLNAADFYGEGCDGASFVTVDAGIERPSGLSKEVDFGVAEQELEKENEQEKQTVVDERVLVPAETTPEVAAAPVLEPTKAEEEAPIHIFADEPIATETPTPVQEVGSVPAPAAEAIPATSCTDVL
ncbi:hypothetical protein BDV95DRAFT_521928 [Massariosphaeria phaeospora]|uniref:Thymidylate kinase n=1 Tax=Massariosphaeria phaeospora TaxID=100035 RepID=A0A7C8MEF4_9PLEO|nr:hypothetical protein BDV95DRAFT_521928 [Massariosphaeria phaeospora]